MKLLTTLCTCAAIVSSAVAAPLQIQVTAKCTGAPVLEAARTEVTKSAIKPLADGSTEPVKITIHSGQLATLEMVREFRYPKVLVFSKNPEAPIAPTEFTTKNTGLSIAVTATRDGDQIVFHGTCILRRPASSPTIAKFSTPKDQPCVTSTAFINRECDFAGRTPTGTPVKINLGEEGIDTGELILTFANVP